MDWIYHDGGRAEAGFKGMANDCVARAIAIATERPYLDVYIEINKAAQRERPRKGKTRSGARTGVKSPTLRRYMASLGWTWVPTMFVGSGTKVHLRADELPPGRLVVDVSRHCTAVIDGVIYDTHDPSRDETRCVYGFFYYYKEQS